MPKGRSQIVTGMNVDRKLSTASQFRGGCMALIREGQAAAPPRLQQIVTILRGKLSYARSREGTFAVRLEKRLRHLEDRLKAQ